MLLLLLVFMGWTAKASPSLFELKAQLSQAQKDIVVLEHKIECLKEEIARKEMTFIRIQLDKARAQLNRKQTPPRRRHLSYLMGQREVLDQIIELVPSCGEEASKLHDELLHFITDLDNAQLLETKGNSR